VKCSEHEAQELISLLHASLLEKFRPGHFLLLLLLRRRLRSDDLHSFLLLLLFICSLISTLAGEDVFLVGKIGHRIIKKWTKVGHEDRLKGEIIQKAHLFNQRGEQTAEKSGEEQLLP